MCDEKTAASSFDACEGVKSVVAKDPTTVVVTYAQAQPFYFQWGLGINTPILQKAQYANCLGVKAKDCPADLKPIGTGPYKVNTFKPGDVVQYDLNENFRDPNKPFFKTVTFKGGGDAASAARAVFQTGDVDYAWNLQVEASVLKPMAASSTTGRLLTSYGSSVERLLINFSNPDPSLGDKRGEPDTKHPFFNGPDGLQVRRALAMATDRASIATQLYGDGLTGKASCNILTAPEPMNSKATDSLDVCKFSLDAANAELEKAGWVKGSDGVRAKGGQKLKIVYQTTVNSVRQSTQAINKSNWEKVGFQLRLKSVPATSCFTNTSPDGATRCWPGVNRSTTSGDTARPACFRSGWACKNPTAKASTWNRGNPIRYCNPDFDKVVDQLLTEV